MKKYLSLLIVALMLLAVMPASAQDLPYAVGEGDFTWDSYEEFADANDFAGETVSIAGPWLTAEADAFERVADYFEEATGATVVYSGSDSFEQQIIIDVEAGSPPNLASFPQPGLAANLAERGDLASLGDDMQQWVLDNYAAGESWVDLGTYENAEGEEEFYGFFFNVNLKSIVWYVPDNFTDAGYEVPETMEDLIALSEQIVEDGGTPWCIGLGSGDATGWPATDWVEDIMLRTQSPEIYDQWVSNELPFNSPEVINAIETFGMFAKNDEWVNGGSASVGATDFRDSPAGLFTVPPQCYMHRQASFISAQFPEDVEVGVDADFFYFPAFEAEDLGNPVLGAGTLLAITEDSEATRGFVEFLTLPLAHEIWMAEGGFLTPHTGVNLDTYADDTVRGQGEILQNASTFRFDGSDLMPGSIGAGAFWTAMVDFVSGAEAQDVADQVQSAWESLSE